MRAIDSQPNPSSGGVRDVPAVADIATLARYWNDDLPDAVNVATISWWLSQPSALDDYPTD